MGTGNAILEAAKVVINKLALSSHRVSKSYLNLLLQGM
jgi:hypothetical protein